MVMQIKQIVVAVVIVVKGNSAYVFHCLVTQTKSTQVQRRPLAYHRPRKSDFLDRCTHLVTLSKCLSSNVPQQTVMTDPNDPRINYKREKDAPK